jgi:hypothetical protein
MRRKYVEYLVVGLFIVFAVGQAEAQFYKVYGWKTPEAGEIELVYWTTYIASSDFQYSFFGNVVEREGLVAHSFEVEYGVTDRFTLAAYLDFENPPNADFKYTRFRAVFFRYRFFNKGEHFLDPAIYIEYYIPKKEYDSEELEVRLILEKDINNFTLSTNTMFEKKTSGHEVDEGLELNFAAGLYYRKYQAIQPGIEYYGKYGEFSDFEELDEQQHILFPTVDLRFGTGFHWHIGIGFGLTEASDDVTVKSIFSYEF